ncbi:hypothetical protein SELMODRAFT_84108 [Selaginella moellendorffii]|uniref:Pentacotripeptide-repeat region of PRORP domain-containing protein n=1 Tax=Selaginella moellendorffii TaxID=88036 RepID=D8R442_SELML|nr:hypothetical protein SELMODRAFT_84108 [Selaginella moellendorffii]
MAVCSWNGEGRRGLEIFWRMHQMGVRPDGFSFSTAIGACTAIGDFAQGWSILGQIRCLELDRENEILAIKNALLAKYSQCGGLQEARSIFSSSGQHRDVISWSSMIESCAHHGRGEESLALFRRMQQEGVDPNAITFLSILSACRHSGFLDEEALRCVGAMEADYGIQPGQEHRACVVDLLGIAGRLKEAENLITADDRSHGEVAWTSFLGGCRVHPDEAGAIERAQEQVQHCESSGFHILLSNVKSG